jgi:hypothetical protein
LETKWQVVNQYGNDAISEDYDALFASRDLAEKAKIEVETICPDDTFRIVMLEVSRISE